MSVYKIAIALAGVLVCVAMVTALAGVGSDSQKPVAVKSDRLDLRADASQCPAEPWPFGCQWRATPKRQLTRQ
jgi:hypothetical protein